jgi:hypothetical protein
MIRSVDAATGPIQTLAAEGCFMMLQRLPPTLVLLALTACGGQAALEAEQDREAAPSASGAPFAANPPPMTTAGRGTVEELELDGVLVYSHSSQDYDLALMTGPASIVGGCLRVSDYVVIWHESRLPEARAAIAAIRAGQSTRLSLGGGGSLPEVARSLGITERCGVDNVWFSDPARP